MADAKRSSSASHQTLVLWLKTEWKLMGWKPSGMAAQFMCIRILMTMAESRVIVMVGHYKTYIPNE